MPELVTGQSRAIKFAVSCLSPNPNGRGVFDERIKGLIDHDKHCSTELRSRKPSLLDRPPGSSRSDAAGRRGMNSGPTGLVMVSRRIRSIERPANHLVDRLQLTGMAMPWSSTQLTAR